MARGLVAAGVTLAIAAGYGAFEHSGTPEQTTSSSDNAAEIFKKAAASQAETERLRRLVKAANSYGAGISLEELSMTKNRAGQTAVVMGYAPSSITNVPSSGIRRPPDEGVSQAPKIVVGARRPPDALLLPRHVPPRLRSKIVQITWAASEEAVESANQNSVTGPISPDRLVEPMAGEFGGKPALNTFRIAQRYTQLTRMVTRVAMEALPRQEQETEVLWEKACGSSDIIQDIPGQPAEETCELLRSTYNPAESQQPTAIYK